MRKTSRAVILASVLTVCSAGGSVFEAAAADAADWDNDWTALTLSGTGAWGSYTSPSRVDAMIGAMTQCRENAGATGSGCGSRITTVRAGWSLAYACSGETFIVTGTSYPEARASAIQREIELREIDLVDIGECRPVVAIGPDGQSAPPAMLSEVMPVIPDRPSDAQSASRR